LGSVVDPPCATNYGPPHRSASDFASINLRQTNNSKPLGFVVGEEHKWQPRRVTV
jgi:hypothetical protein